MIVTPHNIKENTDTNTDTGNQLFPVFLQLQNLRLLIVGGGFIALEKLKVVLFNSPATKIILVSVSITEDIVELAKIHSNLSLVRRAFVPSDLDTVDLAIVAVNNLTTARSIYDDAKQKGKLINVADNPELCDFYLSSVVKKGNLKIAISTNGKSPTLAKRLKETFNDLLPDEIDDVLSNLQMIRNNLKGDFADKVSRLNEITQILSMKGDNTRHVSQKRNVSIWIIIAIASIIIGYMLSIFVPVENLFLQSRNFLEHIDNRIYWMTLIGFGVEMIAGSMGMGYGVICTSVLMSMGLSLPVISSSVHTSEMFGSAASALSHLRYRNINKVLFKSLAIPGAFTAILGAMFIIKFGDKYAFYLKPAIALYTLFLGIRIFMNAFAKKKKVTGKIKHAGWLGALGGFIDSVGGGGWGPLVTSTIIAKGRTPRYAIGTSVAAKFCITVTSAFTFFFIIGISQWPIILGLLTGGVLAAPLAARLTVKLPPKKMFAAVGILVISISLRTILKSFNII
jgi:siroheme synthase-like protein